MLNKCLLNKRGRHLARSQLLPSFPGSSSVHLESPYPLSVSIPPSPVFHQGTVPSPSSRVQAILGPFLFLPPPSSNSSITESCTLHFLDLCLISLPLHPLYNAQLWSSLRLRGCRMACPAPPLSRPASPEYTSELSLPCSPVLRLEPKLVDKVERWPVMWLLLVYTSQLLAVSAQPQPSGHWAPSHQRSPLPQAWLAGKAEQMVKAENHSKNVSMNFSFKLNPYK